MAEHKALKCKSCNAPLSVEVTSKQLKSLSCEYCGQLHSTKENYRSLHTFINPLENFERIALGTRGTIKGIEFVVIGYVVYTDKFTKDLNLLIDGEYWIEYQIYSKTHGYAFLTEEDGEYAFYRKVYDLPIPLLTDIKEEDHSLHRKLDFEVVEEEYTAYLYFVAGSLTWIAKVGEQTQCIDAETGAGWFSSVDYFLSYEKSKNEEEYFLGEPIELDNNFYNGISKVKQKILEEKKEERRKKKEEKKEKIKAKKKRNIKSVRRKNRHSRRNKKVTTRKEKHSNINLFAISFMAFVVSVIALGIILIKGDDFSYKSNFSGNDFNRTDMFMEASSIKYNFELSRSIPFEENHVTKITLRNLTSKQVVFNKDINLTYTSLQYQTSFKILHTGTYRLSIEQKTKMPAILKVKISKPILARYFILLMIISIAGMIVDHGITQKKYTASSALKLLIAFSIGLYLSVLVPPLFMFFVIGILSYAAYTFGTVAFIVTLVMLIVGFNLLT